MPKRNLKEVLGFISRWGNSNFSSKYLSEVLSPDQIKELGEKDPKNKLKLIQLAKSREERLSKLKDALDNPKKFRSATFDPATGKVIKSKGFLTKLEMAKRQIKATGFLGRVGNDMEKITDIDLPKFTTKDLSTKSRTATPADMKEIKAIRDKEQEKSTRKNTNIQSNITGEVTREEEKRKNEQELLDRIDKLRKPGVLGRASTATTVMQRFAGAVNSLASGKPGEMGRGVGDVVHIAGALDHNRRRGEIHKLARKYENLTGRRVSRNVYRSGLPLSPSELATLRSLAGGSRIW